MLRPALLCGPLFLSILNYRAANCPRIAAPYCASVECPAALFYISAQPKPSIFGWLFITHLLLVINGELGQFALYHQHFMWLPCFCFPAVPHFNNRYLRVTCSTSRTSTATSTAMAGLRINDQKNAIAVTMTTVTAFKICISHRKNGFLNRPNTQVSFPTFLQ